MSKLLDNKDQRKRGESMNRIRQLWDYASKVYGLDRFLRRYRDSRVNPRIPSSVIISLLLAGIAGRVGSLYQLERMGKNGELDGAVRFRKKPSADTIGYALCHRDLKALMSYNAEIIQKARRNKAHSNGTICGWRVCAVDGTEPHQTKRPCKKALGWAKRRRSNGEEEYYERAVAISYIGQEPRLVITMMRIMPGESEVEAALRAIHHAYQQNWRYCDIICADALYAQAPFINAVVDQNKDVVVKVKREELHIVRDMKGLVAKRGPDVSLYGVTPKGEPVPTGHGVSYDIKLWDEEGLTSWEQVRVPLRCVLVRETKKVTRRGEVIEEVESEYCIVTTVPKALMKPEVLWQIVHRRWDIENSVFCDLKMNWEFGHCYAHDVRAIEAIYALYCIAVNLMLLFAYRHLRDAPKRGVTLTELARQILVGLTALRTALPIPMCRSA